VDFYVEVKKSSEKQENFLLFYQLESVPRNSGLEDYLSLLNLPNMLLQRYSYPIFDSADFPLVFDRPQKLPRQ
jgi:hypothetical protein